MVEFLFILLSWFIYALCTVLVLSVIILGLVWVLDHTGPTEDSREDLPHRNP